jgi:hypothetical protein
MNALVRIAKRKSLRRVESAIYTNLERRESRVRRPISAGLPPGEKTIRSATSTWEASRSYPRGGIGEGSKDGPASLYPIHEYGLLL